MDEPIYIDRPPRIQPELPFDEIEIPAPPDKEERGFAQLIQVSLPLITIIGYVLIATLGGTGRTPWLLIPMALAVVGSTIFSIYSYRKEKQRRAEIEKAYGDRLVELNEEMWQYQDMQRRFYRYNYPDKKIVFDIARKARAEVEKSKRTLRAETRLWERRVADDDFGVVRLGMGTLPSTVVYKLSEVDSFEDPQVREAMKLEEDSRFVSDIPVIISLRKTRQEDEEDEGPQRTPVTHCLGIAGQQADVYKFTQALLAHFTVFHAPMDARLLLLAPYQESWVWAEDLPHCQESEQTEYLCFLDQVIDQKASEEEIKEAVAGRLEQYLEGVRKILAQRKIRLQDQDEDGSKGDPRLPFLLVVVDLLAMPFAEESPYLQLNDLESDAAISILIEEGARLGAAIIFLVPERSKIPAGATAIIEIEKTTPATNSRSQQQSRLHFRYAETGVNSFRYVGQADFYAQIDPMHELARRMSKMKVRTSYGAGLTNVVPFMDLMGYQTMQDLEVDARQKWQESMLPKYANWLQVKFGLMSGNKPRTLTFSAKADGVHGMVAGSTGSGKSELLIAMIVGMAATYDPSTLNFVLVDYKGGGAFKEFEGLPHCVDIITNLEAAGVTRMFTAIQSEMQRRQALNSSTDTKDIIDYRRKGLHKTHQPYPFLFIIIDEFAEMIADRPEYRGELESITRVGRAQGVSLILAAQRPSGVTDQMRSNIKFRICLRVETPAESREMLRRNDAAYLPGGIPGRGYLQVGNEEIEMVQVAYTGEPYIDPNAAASAAVIWPDRRTYDPSQEEKPPELYKAIIKRLDNLANQEGLESQRAPWPDFLPHKLSLSELLIASDHKTEAITAKEYLADVDRIMLGQEPENILTLNPAINKWINGENGWLEEMDWHKYALRPVVGLVDNPFAAQQMPLVIDIPRGHVAIFGGAGWGKTTFIRSLIVSLTATHSPNHLHIYILDLGGRNLEVLENLPHVGSVIIPDAEGYEERVEQLFRDLDDAIEKRKQILSQAGIPDIYQYNQQHSGQTIPAILIAIDNFIEFKETFESNNDNVESVMDKFVALARRAKPYGIHFVISVNQLSVLSNQLFSVFTERLTLKLADPTEYRPIVGGQVTDIGDIPGRGYTKIGHQPLLFQIGLPIDLKREGAKTQVNENDELRQYAKSMRDYIKDSAAETESEQPVVVYQEPTPIKALPPSILFREILSRQLEILFNEAFLEQLHEYAAQQWQSSLQPEQADWLQATLGVISGNRLRTLSFEAKKDGVHGLIAGGTGSGKSELLMTLIVSLALNYDPTVLNFVLVDYKGGGAFKPFENLPHCVDSISNLNKAAVQRMFTAITAEMQRRQWLNADTNTKDIVDYRRKGYHLSREPYPHLFIIIDEYAEMITDSPEFKDELDSITRLGRAQGINLLLASQRPIGVTDQMRANIKFRICLRVEGIETSREMLRRSDAAFLPNGMPGRGYLQVGNENIELMQVAYTGDEYPYGELLEGDKRPKFYDVVVNLANELLIDEKQRPLPPWPPFLAKQFTLTQSLVRAYLPAEYEAFVTTSASKQPILNPLLQAWLEEQQGEWPGVNWRQTALRAVVGLVDDPYNATQFPLIIDLSKGHLVLFGASGWGKTTFIRTLIMSLAATHSPAECQAHILDLGGRNLEALGTLPHVGSIIMPDERGYEEQVQQLLRELNDIIDIRKRLFSEVGVSTLYEYNNNLVKDTDVQSALVILIDNFAEFIETFGGNPQQDNEDNILESFIVLVRQAKAYGVHFVITADRLNVLSSKIYSLFTERLTLRLADNSSYRSIVGGNVPDIEEVPGRGYVKMGRQPLAFQIAVAAGKFDEQEQLQGEIKQIRAVGQAMSQAWTGVEPLRIAALPQSSLYRQVLADIFNIGLERDFLDNLQKAVAQQWQKTRLAEEADWLEVVLGITSGNRKRKLHFSAKTDGVHGLIAGGTGSGKSELLMTMIVGLAINYDPSILNFVLVDYKGGGAFQPFERLPHCVDIVTNLNKAAVKRMFTSISAEMRRRQALNAETGTKDIIDYRKNGLHLTHAPYPHLFIIIDEYAEMIDDNPEYKAELESITRVGRAQGVNLILASQRPKGVSDQMRANIKLRICLRVEELDTSRELLRRPDAALLPNGLPGRGYLQIGNENLELIQVSWTGDKQRYEKETLVEWPERADGLPATSDDTLTLYESVVNMTADIWGEMAPKPWPGFLPKIFSLQSTIYDAQKNQPFTLTTAVTNWLNGETANLWSGINWRTDALRPVVGLLDNPPEAQQTPLQFDLTRTHLALFGDSGWGKTSFLRTLVVSLAVTHSPDECHIYILDLGGRNYRSLEDLPHVGTVIYADEAAYEERLQRLFDRLERLVDERQQLLSNTDFASLYEYNQQNPEQLLTPTVVIIDNIAELRENYEMLIETTLVPLIRRSLSAGVSFVVSGNTPNNMPSKLNNLFNERLTFKQSNSDRYMEIVGRGAMEIDDIPGRGYMRVGRQPLLFQAALPVGIFDEQGYDELSEADELRRLAQQMQVYVNEHMAAWQRPDSIKTLPELVSLREMIAAVDQAAGNQSRAILGQNSRLQPALFDLKLAGPHFAVVGPPLSGKTTTLHNWILSLAYCHPPQRAKLVLIDMQDKLMKYGGEHRLDELPHVLTAVTEPEQIETLYQQLKAECDLLANDKNSDHQIFIIIDNFDDFVEELERNRNISRDLMTNLAGLARRYGTDGLHFVIGGTLDSGVSELRRRILAANYGVALRTAQALDTLRVSRRPPEMRGKELPVGRGYVVRSGLADMIQIASPYISVHSEAHLAGLDADNNRQAEMLDEWVKIIKDQHPEQRAEWVELAPTADGDELQETTIDPELKVALGLVRRIMVAHEVVDVDTAVNWNEKDVIVKYIKDALQKEMGIDPDLLFDGNIGELLLAAADKFPEISKNGAGDSQSD